MHPPAETCRKLKELDPTLRLCWLGADLDEEFDSTNEGSFGVVQLRSKRSVVDENGEPLCFEPMFPQDFQRPGPVFNGQGGTTPDWDPVTQQPVLICTVTKTWGMSTQDVFGDRLVDVMRRARKTRKEHDVQRRRELEQAGKDHAAQKDELVEGMTAGIAWGQRQTNADRVVIARKHWKEHLREKRARMRRRIGLENLQLYREGML